MKRLIKNSEVVEKSPVDDKFPAIIFEPHIKRIERKTFRQELGLAFYDQLLKDRDENGSFKTAEFQKFWDDYLIEYLAFKVALGTSTYANIKYTADGIAKKESDYSTSASLKELGAYKTNLKHDIDDMFVEIDEYLRGKPQIYSLYLPNMSSVPTPKKRRRRSRFILPRRTKEVSVVSSSVTSSDESELPKEWIYEQEHSSLVWSFSYKDKIINEDILIDNVWNSNGTPILDFLESGLIETTLQEVRIVLKPNAFIDEDTRIGKVKLISEPF